MKRSTVFNFKNNKDKLRSLTKSLLFEILKAVLIAAAVSISFYLFNLAQEKSNEIEKLSSIGIGISKEYVDSVLGPAKITFTENDLTNSYYKLKHSVVRCVYNNDLIVGYFITLQDNIKYPVPDIVFKDNPRYLLDINFYELGPPDSLEANSFGKTYYDYYSEMHYYGNPGGYNNYYFAILPYGFRDDQNADLVVNATMYLNSDFYKDFLDDDKENLDKTGVINNLKCERSISHPNTIGAVANSYDDSIDIVPMIDSWNNHYRMLY